MTINNPPVFNRIIASGGEIGTVEVTGGVMQWTFDNTETNVDTIESGVGVTTQLYTADEDWDMFLLNQINIALPFARANTLSIEVLLLDTPSDANYRSPVGIILAGQTIVTCGAITAFHFGAGATSTLQLRRDNSSFYNSPSDYRSIVARVLAHYIKV